jgi:hypothetical protein
MKGAPPRLIDDPSAPSALRHDLRSTAKAVHPVDSQRGLARLRASIAAPNPGGSPGLGPTFWGLTAIGTAIAIGGIVTAGVYLAPTHATPRRAAAQREIPRADAPPIALPLARVQAPVEIARVHREAPIGRRIVQRERAVPPIAEPELDPDIAMRLEVAQLARIRSLLPSDPSAALRLCEEGQRRFPSGMFREERDAISVLSLARLGRRDEARARAEAFLRHHPRGPFSEEIRNLLARP